jgi:hypothetical protein
MEAQDIKRNPWYDEDMIQPGVVDGDRHDKGTVLPVLRMVGGVRAVQKLFCIDA